MSIRLHGMALELWPHHRWKLLRRSFFLYDWFWAHDFQLLVGQTVVLESLELSLIISLVHYLSSWCLTRIIAGILMYQKLINFFAHLWDTLFLCLWLNYAIFVRGFIVDSDVVRLLNINFEGFRGSLSDDFRLVWWLFKASSCSEIVLIASGGQIAYQGDALSALGVWTFEQLNLLGQLLLLLLYYILLLFRPKLRHFPHFFVSCVAIEIIFGEEYLWLGAIL